MEEKTAPHLSKMTDAELQAVVRDVRGTLKVVMQELQRRNTEIVRKITPPPSVRDGEKQRG